MSSDVRLLRTLLVGLITLLWVPLSSHCILESVSGLTFLECASEPTPACAGPGHGCETDHGEDELCCLLESADFYAKSHRELAPARAENLIPAFLAFEVATTRSLEPQPRLQTGSPPDLQRSWHFRFRSALPVRAPSIAS